MHPMSTTTNGGVMQPMHHFQSVPTMGSLQSLPPTPVGAHTMSTADFAAVVQSGGAKIVGLINHGYNHLQPFSQSLINEFEGFAGHWQKIFSLLGTTSEVAYFQDVKCDDQTKVLTDFESWCQGIKNGTMIVVLVMGYGIMVGAGSLALVPVDWHNGLPSSTLKPLPKEFMNILQEKNQKGINHMLCITCKCLSRVGPSAEAVHIRGTNYHMMFAGPTSKAAYVGGVKEFPGWSNFGAIYQQKLDKLTRTKELKTASPYSSLSDILAECNLDLEQRGLIDGDAYPNELVSKTGSAQGIAMGWSDALFGIGSVVQAVAPHAFHATKAAFQAYNSLGAVADPPPAALHHVLPQNPSTATADPQWQQMSSSSRTLAPGPFVSQPHPTVAIPAAADLAPPSPQDGGADAADCAACTCTTPMEADSHPPPRQHRLLERVQGDDNKEEVYEGLLEINDIIHLRENSSRLQTARLFVSKEGIVTFEGTASTSVRWCVMNGNNEFKDFMFTTKWTQPVAANQITKVHIQWDS